MSQFLNALLEDVSFGTYLFIYEMYLEDGYAYYM